MQSRGWRSPCITSAGMNGTAFLGPNSCLPKKKKGVACFIWFFWSKHYNIILLENKGLFGSEGVLGKKKGGLIDDIYKSMGGARVRCNPRVFFSIFTFFSIALLYSILVEAWVLVEARPLLVHRSCIVCNYIGTCNLYSSNSLESPCSSEDSHKFRIVARPSWCL